MTRPLDPRNPGVHFQTARASVAAIRPSTPTEQPFAPPKKYACIGCGTAVELELLAPLPVGWVTVQVAGIGAGGDVTYRCDRCAKAAKSAAKKGRRA